MKIQVILAVCAAVGFGAANAAEITVLSTQATEQGYRELLPQFEKATGNTVKISYTGTLDAKKRIAAGEFFDVLIMASPDIDAFVAIRHAGARQPRRPRQIRRRHRRQGRRAEARHQHHRGLQEDVAGGKIDRLFHRTERQLCHRPVRSPGHCRSDQAEAQADADRRVRRHHHGQWRGRNRHPAGERDVALSPASTMSARCRPTSRR